MLLIFLSVLQNSFIPSSVISVHPNTFSLPRSSSLTTVRDGWFVKLSSYNIPVNIQCFLQLGYNFTLPFVNKNKLIFDCIKGVESALRMSIDRRIDVINHSISILNNIISSPIFSSPTDKQLLRIESDFRTFVSAHPNIVFIHADKSNVTVMDRDTYYIRTK